MLTYVLKGGNGYTFSIALLAGSCAFIVEKKPETSYGGLRTFAMVVTVVLGLFLTLYSGMHFVGKLDMASAATAGVAENQSALRWTNRETWQLILLLLTAVYSTWLFCLQCIDDHEDYAVSLRDRRSELVSRANAATSGSGIQA